METAKAYELIAELLGEWFDHVEWSAELIAEIDRAIGSGNEEALADPTMHYAVFGLALFRRSGVLDE
jgi:hypothetical protein